MRPQLSHELPLLRGTLNPAHGAVAPISRPINGTISLARSSNKAAARCRIARRSPGDTAAHSGRAAAAASTARRASETDAVATLAISSPVTASVVVKNRPLSAAVGTPPMKSSELTMSSRATESDVIDGMWRPLVLRCTGSR
jgi:hypothetical protein